MARNATLVATGPPAAVPVYGPRYLAMRVECETPTAHAKHTRHVLPAATVSGSTHHGDSPHSSSAGTAAAAPLASAGAEAAKITPVPRDSTLDTVNEHARNRPSDAASSAPPADSEPLTQPACCGMRGRIGDPRDFLHGLPVLARPVSLRHPSQFKHQASDTTLIVPPGTPTYGPLVVLVAGRHDVHKKDADTVLQPLSTHSPHLAGHLCRVHVGV